MTRVDSQSFSEVLGGNDNDNDDKQSAHCHRWQHANDGLADVDGANMSSMATAMTSRRWRSKEQ